MTTIVKQLKRIVEHSSLHPTVVSHYVKRAENQLSCYYTAIITTNYYVIRRLMRSPNAHGNVMEISSISKEDEWPSDFEPFDYWMVDGIETL